MRPSSFPAPWPVLVAIGALLCALLSVPVPAQAAGSSEFVGITPVRVKDTRSSTPVLAGTTLAVPVAGQFGVPADAGAVSLNVTVTLPTERGWITAYPCGSDKPNASNLNYVAGQTVPNAVIVKVGTSGQVCFFSSGTTQLIVDLNGYFPAGSKFSGINPVRAADTRNGTGVRPGIVPSGATLEVPVAGVNAVPSDASAVALNVTVVYPSARGWATVFPCGVPLPTASNINYLPGQTIPNSVISAVGAGGSVCVFVTAAAHVVVDVTGYFPADSRYEPFVPERIFDSRVDDPGIMNSGDVLGFSGLEGIAALSLNVTVTQPQGRGWITVFPCDAASVPNASNVNYVAGQTVANAVVAPVGADGTLCFYAYTTTHLIIDVNGVFPAD